MHDFDNTVSDDVIGTDRIEQNTNSAESESVADLSRKTTEGAPRVTENAPENKCAPLATGECATTAEARILTIPGAVYRIPTVPVVSKEEQPKEEQVAAVAALPIAAGADDAEELGEVGVEAVADEMVDDVHTIPVIPPYEPQSKISHPAVSDVAENDVVAVDADYAKAHRHDDAGAYVAPFEHKEPEPVSDEQHPIAIPYDPSYEEEEYTRFLTEQQQKRENIRSKRRVSLEKNADHVSLPVDSIDKCVKLVESRMLYEIETMKAKHRMLGYTFSIDVLKKDRTGRQIRRQINERMCKLSRALKRERFDSTRYYTAALDKYVGSADKRKGNEARIESILSRLDYALKEREHIDESLMRLYGQRDEKALLAKEAKVAEKAAKAAYKSQLRVAKRVVRMHVPEELKEKILSLMNERITALSTLEKNRYLLSQKRYTGADKRDVKRQNRDLKRSLKHNAEDIRYFIKKAEKHDTAHGDGMKQAAWLLLTLLLVGAVVAVYFLGKNYWGWF